MKKNDIILTLSILFLAIFLLISMKMTEEYGQEAVVYIDGTEYGRYSLREEQEIKIHETNILMIKNRKADMIQANCPDRFCVRQKAIGNVGESLICLPNRIVIAIEGGSGSQQILDGVVY